MIYCVNDIMRSTFKDSASKIIWILIVLFMPLLGSLAYLGSAEKLKPTLKIDI